MGKFAMIVLAVLFIAGIPAEAVEEPDALTYLMMTAEQTDVAIDGWNVVMKEKIEKEEAQSLLEQVKNRHQVSIIEEENIVKYKIVGVNHQVRFEVIFHFPKEPLAKHEVIAALSGKGWNEAIEKQYQSMKDHLDRTLFTGEKKTFSWMELRSDGIMKKVPLHGHWTNLFNLQHVTKHYDKTANKTFTYGFTPHIKETINIDKIPINLQLVTEEDETGFQKMTIGTPILIHEY